MTDDHVPAATPSAERPWTFDRIRAERPDVAPLAALHADLQETARRVIAGEGEESFRPRYGGTPATHWVLGRALFDGCDQRALLAPVITLFGALAGTLRNAHPAAAPALDELRAAVAADDFPWASRIASFRDPLPADVVPHAGLFRFLLLRALAVPLARLARSASPPHPDRWLRPACPYCGFAAVAQVARPGSARQLVCVLCAGTWSSADLSCLGCGSDMGDTWRVLALRELGPASLESCGTCRTTLKVFPPFAFEPSSDAAADPSAAGEAVVALEILTVGLDLLAAEQEGLQREQAPLGAVFPPP